MGRNVPFCRHCCVPIEHDPKLVRALDALNRAPAPVCLKCAAAREAIDAHGIPPRIQTNFLRVCGYLGVPVDLDDLDIAVAEMLVYAASLDLTAAEVTRVIDALHFLFDVGREKKEAP